MYRGRFAPSPTGPLHRGSLVAAVGSYLGARRAGGQWLVRMEDVDGPRCVPGAGAKILRCLEACGLEWDGEVVYQSTRFDAYRAALDRLTRAGFTYPCACSRKELGDAAVYPGTCRGGLAPGRRAERAVRFRVPEPCVIEYRDAVCGWQREDVARSTGDFVLLRADGIWAYQLAVVVDDAWQGITDVVRGADLLDSTARQIALQRALEVPAPRYAHLPVVMGDDGQKLSKQTKAMAVEWARQPGAAVAEAMRFLGMAVTDEMARWEPRELLAWGSGAWTLG